MLVNITRVVGVVYSTRHESVQREPTEGDAREARAATSQRPDTSYYLLVSSIFIYAYYYYYYSLMRVDPGLYYGLLDQKNEGETDSW